MAEKLSGSNLPGADHSKDVLPDLSQFSLILDCTDNPTSRYLISDACAAYAIPLVSGAAIRTEGQLSVWNLPSLSGPDLGIRGPCYRCVFPETNKLRAERCADEGVLGPAVGVVGVLMAWEAIRLLIGKHDLKPKLLIVPSFRTIKLRNAKSDCEGCSPASRTAFMQRLQYQSRECDRKIVSQPGCNSTTCSKKTLVADQSAPRRITVDDLVSGRKRLEEFHLIDVRPQTQFGICALPNSTNVPIKEILENPQETITRLTPSYSKPHDVSSGEQEAAWLIVCRRGNDSQLAVEALRGIISEVFDLEGGLEAYAAFVDSSFPVY